MITPEQIARESEHSQQAALFCQANLHLHKYSQLKWMHSSGNGIFTTSGQKAKEKAAGLRKGVWDVFLPYPKDGWAGLYVEMKVGKNILTKDQEEFGRDMANFYKLEVCWSWQEAWNKIVKYLEG